MSNFGVTVAIIREGQVLLIKREDFEIWSLPGGIIDPDESVAQAALREAREETGLEVELTRLVGTYSVHFGRRTTHSVLFAARPIGGTLQPQTGETLDLAYFMPDELPELTTWWHHQKIRDAFNGTQGAAWRVEVDVTPPFQDREELYRLRDISGLSRSEFYRHYFKKPKNGALVQELRAYTSGGGQE